MYFEKAGHHNTDKSLEIAFSEAAKRGIKHVVIASSLGDTAEKALEYKKKNPDLNIVVVTHNTGFKTPGVQEFREKTGEMMKEAGIQVLTGTMVTRNLGKSIKKNLGFSQEDVCCSSWRMFGQGTKVCIEIAAMACDAGLIPPDDVISVSGTGRGADTVIIISAMPSNEMFGMKIREILAKPLDW
ncbi:MAG: hypothetical protein K8T10_11630 [Candidatus Eremiobacteraeota bacterium]|nr:hypothetical protein [Candidatus Eremiobacteraeota bacterium]